MLVSLWPLGYTLVAFRLMLLLRERVLDTVFDAVRERVRERLGLREADGSGSSVAGTGLWVGDAESGALGKLSLRERVRDTVFDADRERVRERLGLGEVDGSLSSVGGTELWVGDAEGGALGEGGAGDVEGEGSVLMSTT